MGSTPKVGAMDGRAFVPVKPILSKNEIQTNLFNEIYFFVKSKINSTHQAPWLNLPSLISGHGSIIPSNPIMLQVREYEDIRC